MMVYEFSGRNQRFVCAYSSLVGELRGVSRS